METLEHSCNLLKMISNPPYSEKKVVFDTQFEMWMLLHLSEDDPVKITISYCPYCGQKLEKPTK